MHKEAILDFDKVIKINPKFAEAYQNRAISKAMLNLNAINDFDQVVILSPDDPEGYYNRAIYFINFKIKRDYCSDLKKAFSLGYDPSKELLTKYCKA